MVRHPGDPLSAQPWWISQSAHPHGRFASAFALVLNFGNGRFNAAAVDALSPRPGDRLLEVGFGGGTGLRRALDVPASRVAGIDLSEELVARARRVFAKDVGRGRLRLEHGSVEAMPFADQSFDGVFSVNCIYFWPDPARGLHEMCRVLRCGGMVVLGVDARWKKLFRDPYRGFDASDAELALVDAGFVAVRSRVVTRHKALVTAKRP